MLEQVYVDNFMPLWDFKRAVIEMRLFLRLRDAIEKRNTVEIVRIITYFAFEEKRKMSDDIRVAVDGSRKTFPVSNNFEFAYFNQSFREYVRNQQLESQSINSKISSFIKDEKLHIEKLQKKNRKYKDIIFENEISRPTWNTLLNLYEKIISKSIINTISEYGEVSFEPYLTESSLRDIYPDYNSIILLGKAALSDAMNSHLKNITPMLIFERNGSKPNWHLNSLLEAMYLELYFENITPRSKIKKCFNDNCTNFFVAYNPRKIYCSDQCAWATSKRKRRSESQK